MEHSLKCWPEYFSAIFEGRKKVEVRYDDRGYEVGHFLKLEEYIPSEDEEGEGEYTGNVINAEITHILTQPKGCRYDMLGENIVAMSIETSLFEGNFGPAKEEK